MFTYREVFKARNRKTNQIVALKKVRMENEKEGVSPHPRSVDSVCVIILCDLWSLSQTIGLECLLLNSLLLHNCS